MVRATHTRTTRFLKRVVLGGVYGHAHMALPKRRTRAAGGESEDVSSTPPRHVAVAIEDIDDVERFVIATIRKRPGKELDGEIFGELVREGIAIVVRLREQYEPGFGGRDPEGSRFSGYVARYLPGKLDDALHRLKGDSFSAYQDAKCPEEGCTHRTEWRESYWKDPPFCPEHDVACVLDTGRRWSYADDPESLERRVEDGNDDLHTTDDADATLAATLDRLGGALDRLYARERSQTIQVAELLGQGHTAPTVATMLGIRGREVTEAVDRMRRVAHEIVTTDQT
jgi:hypothetical protein